MFDAVEEFHNQIFTSSSWLLTTQAQKADLHEIADVFCFVWSNDQTRYIVTCDASDVLRTVSTSFMDPQHDTNWFVVSA
jgi:hypothetical protein